MQPIKKVEHRAEATNGTAGWAEKWADVILFLRSSSGRDSPILCIKNLYSKKKREKRRKLRILFVFRRALLISCNHMLVLRPIQMKVLFGKIKCFLFFFFVCLFAWFLFCFFLFCCFRCHCYTEQANYLKYAIVISGSCWPYVPVPMCAWKCLCVCVCVTFIHICI